jgi:hypothetical protein
MIWAAYGAIIGNQEEILDFVFTHNEHKIPVLECILNACLMCDNIKLFKQYVKNFCDDSYTVNIKVIEKIIQSDNISMFVEIIDYVRLSEYTLDCVMNFLMKHKLPHLMVKYLCNPKYSKQNLEFNPIHIRYIAETYDNLAELWDNYQREDVIKDIITLIVTKDNYKDIFALMVNRWYKFDEKVLLDLVCGMKDVNDEETIKSILESKSFTLSDIDYAIKAVRYYSNGILLKVLKDVYKLKITPQMVSTLLSSFDDNSDGCVMAIECCDNYVISDIMTNILFNKTMKKSDFEKIFAVIEKSGRVIKLSTYEEHTVGMIEDPETLDYLFDKLLNNNLEKILEAVKYHRNVNSFKYVFNKYFKKESSAIKKKIATELSYNIESMLKNKNGEFELLEFLLKEIDIPLEYDIMENISKTFKYRRYSYTSDSDSVDEIKKTGITFKMLDDLIDFCDTKMRSSLKRRFDNK